MACGALLFHAAVTPRRLRCPPKACLAGQSPGAPHGLSPLKTVPAPFRDSGNQVWLPSRYLPATKKVAWPSLTGIGQPVFRKPQKIPLSENESFRGLRPDFGVPRLPDCRTRGGLLRPWVMYVVRRNEVAPSSKLGTRPLDDRVSHFWTHGSRGWAKLLELFLPLGSVY
jgi:hypothetical protein